MRAAAFAAGIAAALFLAVPAAAQTCPVGQVVTHLPGKLFRCDPPALMPAPALTIPAPRADDGALGAPITVVTPPSGGLVNVGQIFGFLGPYVDAILQALILAGVGALGVFLKQKWNIQVDESLMHTLQVALSNRASSLVADGVVRLSGTKVDVHSEYLAHAANNLIAHNPDIAKQFNLTPDRVAAMIVDKLPTVPAVAQAQATALVRAPQAPAPQAVTDATAPHPADNPLPLNGR